MWMWSLRNPPFFGTISPRLSQSAVRLRTQWLQRRGANQESEPKAVTARQVQASPNDRSASLPRCHRKSRRGVRVVSPSTASIPGRPVDSSAPTGSADEELAVDLDYVPSLGPVREVLCVLVPILLVALLYVTMAPLHGGAWLAAAGCVILAAAMASLARTTWLEQAYKARERAFAALGDGDSHFRPISTRPELEAGGGRRPGVQQQLMVHVKVKVGDLTQRVPGDGSSGDPCGSELYAAAGKSGVLGGVTACQGRVPIPAVHCYHGFGANLGSYKRVQEELAAVLHGVVTAHDMPGFGLTQRPSDISSYFLTFNGRLGRLVLDYELQQLGLLPGRAGPDPPPEHRGAAASATSMSPSKAGTPPPRPSEAQPRTSTSDGSVASTVTASGSLGPRGHSGPTDQLVVTVGSMKDGSGNFHAGEVQQGQSQGEPQPQPSQIPPQDIQRILIGHSLGGACAALEAITNPAGLAGLVLVAPAVFALPGPEYKNVKLSPDRPHGFTGAGAGSATEPAAATEAEQLRTETARAAAHLGFEPPGTHVTDPPEVRRLYPGGRFPASTRGGGGSAAAAAAGGGGRSSDFNGSRLAALVQAARSLLVAAASVALLTVLRLLTPVITLLLRSLVRRRTFWMKGLQQAYYNPGAVTQDIVDAYRLPQLVKGWEAGMVNFLLARLTRPRAGLRELLRSAAKQLEPSTTSALLVSTAAAAVEDAKAAAAAALKPTRDGVRPISSAAGTTPAAMSEVDESCSGADTPTADSMDYNEDDDGDLASRLAGLVARRNLPVLIVHGLYDRLVPASNSQRLARMLPGCELVLLDRCGHMPQEELPHIFVSLVAEFAARVPTAQASESNG